MQFATLQLFTASCQFTVLALFGSHTDSLNQPVVLKSLYAAVHTTRTGVGILAFHVFTGKDIRQSPSFPRFSYYYS